MMEAVALVRSDQRLDAEDQRSAEWAVREAVVVVDVLGRRAAVEEYHSFVWPANELGLKAALAHDKSDFLVLEPDSDSLVMTSCRSYRTYVYCSSAQSEGGGWGFAADQVADGEFDLAVDGAGRSEALPRQTHPERLVDLDSRKNHRTNPHTNHGDWDA